MIESLAEWWTAFLDLRARWGDIVDIFLVVSVVVVINFALSFFLRRLASRVKDSASLWDDAIYHSLNGPLRALVWIVGLSVAAQIGDSLEETIVVEYLPQARSIALVLVIVWFLQRLILSVHDNYLKRAARRGEAVDPTTADAIAKLFRAAVVITGVLVILQNLGVSLSGLLAAGGVGGLALGFAAKDVLANIFGGLTVYLNRPFSVGDWIRSPDQDIEGIVEAVGWRATTVRRFDKRPLYVPNAVFSTVALENPSRMTHRRIFETIGLRYDDAALVVPILSEIREMLDADDEIDSNDLIMVNFNQFGASSLDFFIYCFTVTRQWARYHEVKENVLVRIHEIIEKHGAQVAFPTRTLHVPKGMHLLEDGSSEGTTTDTSAAPAAREDTPSQAGTKGGIDGE